MKETMRKRPEAANVRADSWAVHLTAEQQWELYEKAKEPDPWTLAVRWAVEQYGLDRTPSQSAFYRWKTAMQEQELRFRVKEVAKAAAHTSALGEALPDDQQIVNTFKALATEAALKGDARKAASLLHSADLLLDIARKQIDVRQHINFVFQKTKSQIELEPTIRAILGIPMDTARDSMAGQKAMALLHLKQGAVTRDA